MTDSREGEPFWPLPKSVSSPKKARLNKVNNGRNLNRNKAGHGGNVASLFAAIPFDKGICYWKHYDKQSGKLFAEFENNFIEIFKNNCNPTGNVFVQDVDPVQSSKAAKTVLDKIGAIQLSIFLRSTHLNPIENEISI